MLIHDVTFCCDTPSAHVLLARCRAACVSLARRRNAIHTRHFTRRLRFYARDLRFTPRRAARAGGPRTNQLGRAGLWEVAAIFIKAVGEQRSAPERVRTGQSLAPLRFAIPDRLAGRRPLVKCWDHGRAKAFFGAIKCNLFITKYPSPFNYPLQPPWPLARALQFFPRRLALPYGPWSGSVAGHPTARQTC